MKILLDNCVDARVARLLTGHEVRTAVETGWERLQNGELLDAASNHFDVFVTVDKNIPYQHSLDRARISILELNTRLSRYHEFVELTPCLPQAIEHTRTHRFVSIRAGCTIELLAPIRTGTP